MEQKQIFIKHIELLGFKAKDKVTGAEGVIASISFDAYGCIQADVRPPMKENGEIPNGYWFDITRLKIDKSERVVDLPNFYEGYVAEGRKGASDKTSQRA